MSSKPTFEFDTLQYTKRLAEAGIDRAQAEAQAEALHAIFHTTSYDEFATKNELYAVRDELKHDMSDLRTELKRDMNDLRTELKRDMNDLRTELRHEMAGLRTEIHSEMQNLSQRIVLRLGSLMIVMFSLTGVIVRFLK